jgi:hypothetical protein
VINDLGVLIESLEDVHSRLLHVSPCVWLVIPKVEFKSVGLSFISSWVKQSHDYECD